MTKINFYYQVDAPEYSSRTFHGKKHKDEAIKTFKQFIKEANSYELEYITLFYLETDNHGNWLYNKTYNTCDYINDL